MTIDSVRRKDLTTIGECLEHTDHNYDQSCSDDIKIRFQKYDMSRLNDYYILNNE